MTAVEFVIASLAIAAGAALQGAVGFGLPLVAAPVLVIVDPGLVPGPILFASFVLHILVTVRERASVDVRGVGWAVVGRVPGSFLGALTLVLLPVWALQLAVAVVVLASAALSVSHLRLQPTTGNLLGAGFASGFFTSTSAVGGPPMALLYQRSTGAAMRGTLSGFFLVSGPMSLAILAAVGEFGGDEAVRGLALVPAVAAGFLLSMLLARALDRGRSRAAALILSVASGVAVLVKLVL